MGLVYNTSIVRDGLVLHLDAANVKSYTGSGTTWSDMSGRSNNCTLQNGVQFTTAPTASQPKSFYFDGVDDRGFLSDSPDWTVSETTVCAWFNSSLFTDATFLNRGIVSSYDSGGGQYYGIRVNTGQGSGEIAGQFQTYYDANDGFGFELLNSTTTFELNTWYYGCMTWKAGDHHRMYINGQLEAEDLSVSALSLNPGTHFLIGDDPANGSTHFNGYIGNACIYNRALTADEIAKNYEALRGRYKPFKNGIEVRDAGLPSGVYSIDPDGSGDAFPCYINNDDLDGGWMLIAYHTDTTTTRTAGTPTPGNPSVLNDTQWLKIKGKINDGFMGKDENGLVSFLSKQKWISGNAKTLNDVNSLVNLTAAVGAPSSYPSLWHDEEPPLLSGQDYSMILMRTFQDANNPNQSALFETGPVKFDIWPYIGVTSSRLEQEEMAYYVR